MKTRFLLGLLTLALTPLASFGALSTTTSYFLNVEAITNVSGRVSVNGAAVVGTNSVTGGIMSATKAFQSYQGAALTHAGTVTLDFDASSTVRTISLTGAVTFALSNLATNRTYRLKISNPQATNCTVTLPSNTSTNFLGGAPTTITAGKVAMWSLESWGTANADVISAWAETQ